MARVHRPLKLCSTSSTEMTARVHRPLKLCSTSSTEMMARVHRPLKFLAFHANGIARQRYELSAAARATHWRVCALWDTSETSWEFLYSKSLLSHWQSSGQKRRNCLAVGKGNPHNHVDLLPLVSQEATGSACRLVIVKYYSQLFINLQVVPRLTSTSLSCKALNISP
jgi:hypothetical protein